MRKEKFEIDNVLDLVWDNHYDERSCIKSYGIPYKNFGGWVKCDKAGSVISGVPKSGGLQN